MQDSDRVNKLILANIICSDINLAKFIILHQNHFISAYMNLPKITYNIPTVFLGH